MCVVCTTFICAYETYILLCNIKQGTQPGPENKLIAGCKWGKTLTSSQWRLCILDKTGVVLDRAKKKESMFTTNTDEREFFLKSFYKCDFICQVVCALFVSLFSVANADVRQKSYATMWLCFVFGSVLSNLLDSALSSPIWSCFSSMRPVPLLMLMLSY